DTRVNLLLRLLDTFFGPADCGLMLCRALSSPLGIADPLFGIFGMSFPSLEIKSFPTFLACEDASSRCVHDACLSVGLRSPGQNITLIPMSHGLTKPVALMPIDEFLQLILFPEGLVFQEGELERYAFCGLICLGSAIMAPEPGDDACGE